MDVTRRSIFDMAISPTLFVFTFDNAPSFAEAHHAMYAALFVVGTCAALNLAGIRIIGITSLWLLFLLSSPPLDRPALACWRGRFCRAASGDWRECRPLGAGLVAMSNYMGWDIASTIAQEDERPQRTYPRAMIAASSWFRSRIFFLSSPCTLLARPPPPSPKTVPGLPWLPLGGTIKGIQLAPFPRFPSQIINTFDM